MREMTAEEIRNMIKNKPWATICTVCNGQEPYAVEATPFLLADDQIGFMINPRGTTRKNLLANPQVLIKYTYSSPDLKDWAGVSCFGRGEFCEDKETIANGWKILGKIMNEDYSKAAERFAKEKMSSPLFIAHISRTTGRCSAKVREEMIFPWGKTA